MLGKLFNLGSASGAGASPSPQTASHKPVSSLESVQEDIHTRSLLFPDPQDLYEHRLNQVFPLSSSTPANSSTNAFDYNGDIELDVRDVRIIIMQDALGSVASSLLYDSQAPPPTPTPSTDRHSTLPGSSSLYSAQEARRAPTSPRKSSVSHVQRPIVIQPGSPKMRQGAFDHRSSVYSRNQGYIESDSQRTWREYREELGTFSSCIFGNSELMAYKGTSTKVHVVPCDFRTTETPTLGDGRGSMGRSSMRSSRLSQSFSSENVPPFAMPSGPGVTTRIQDRRKVLITRLFPVCLPNDEDLVFSPNGPVSEDNTGYPFPSSADDGTTKKKKPQPKQKRTPMYAVALVVNLPPPSSHSTPATASRSGFRGPSSYTEQDSFPSSYGSSRPSGWTMVGQGGLGPDSFETPFGSETEDQIDAITQHWDIIMRTLNHLQSVVAATVYMMLKQTDIASPDPLPTLVPSQVHRTQSMSGRRSEDGLPVKPPKTNAKLVTLLPNSLLDHRRIGTEVDAAKTRIVAGIRAARVITGQNRWPIWREEARWVAKWAGGREEGFFFNLLTGFLATHTDWLQALSPPSYRRRHYIQQKGKVDEDSSVHARTIIVAQDKIAARRLIFLLSAFLPASQQLPGIRTHRPSTSASLGTFSQSPPSFVVPILKEESLRRRINRRTGPNRVSHSRNLSLQSQHGRSGAVPPTLAHLSMEGRHERRVSDAASITHLPIRGGDPTVRKSSAATTGTITSETSIPHFSISHRAESFSNGRPSTSNSIAADDLKRITRADSSGPHNASSGDSRQGSKWGSVISGLWSTRRRDSTTGPSKSHRSSTEQVRSSSSPTKTTFNTTKTVPGMISEHQPGNDLVEHAGDTQSSAAAQHGDNLGRPQVTTNTRSPSVPTENIPKMQRTPDPSGAFESPVKTSINLADGVIDVDIPFPDYITSFETAVSSPSSSGYLSTPGFGFGFEAFEQSCHGPMDRDIPLNVAGWLQHYHPDFVLQALPIQEGLIEQIKASMRAEPSPPSWTHHAATSDAGTVERWVDVCTTVIADASTFSLTRLRYRRLTKLNPVNSSSMVDRNNHQSPPSTSTSTNNLAAPPLLTPSIPPYEIHSKEEFIEETLISVEEALVEAVEKVISLNNPDVSKGSSSCSSRSTSKRRDRSNSTSTQSDVRSGHHGLYVPQEVPRSQCKTIVLSALEEIIREVIEEREQVGHDNGGGGGGNGVSAVVRAREGGESALREAVRGWLDSVEVNE
ncbi:folliculin-interacting protein N-terminus-domain-containing protein [Apodospora peruviana]|uniref:Folliculin-interacting protein N-terminus-domain-containing protein n=1 Tax=Apodospora peruviana TaxID=516989 RepID=A0AAE0I4S1_9PEZI|nr:folliculin-interacting protein N-terminus-domain-containing protein [Apodospora peruviana]